MQKKRKLNSLTNSDGVILVSLLTSEWSRWLHDTHFRDHIYGGIQWLLGL
jgi:hypothetical protein